MLAERGVHGARASCMHACMHAPCTHIACTVHAYCVGHARNAAAPSFGVHDPARWVIAAARGKCWQPGLVGLKASSPFAAGGTVAR